MITIRFTAPALEEGGDEPVGNGKTSDAPLVFDVHLRQLKSSDYGTFVWPSAILLAEFLSHHRSLFHGKRVMELGAGIGLAGIVAAKLGATGACRCADLVCAPMSIRLPALCPSTPLTRSSAYSDND